MSNTSLDFRGAEPVRDSLGMFAFGRQLGGSAHGFGRTYVRTVVGMAAIHPHDVETEATDDPWAALAAGAVEAEALTGRLQTLQQRTRHAVAAIEQAAVVEPAEVHIAHLALTAVARLRHAAVTTQVATVPLARRTEVRSSDAQKSARRWLAHQGGLTNAEAGALVRAAQAAEHYDQVADALDQASIAPAHADLIWGIIPSHWRGERLDTAIEMVRDVQHVLVDRAKHLSVNQFRDFCDRVRDRLDTDGPGDPTAEPSRLHLSRSFEGRWLLRGDFTPDDGALIASMIEGQIERTKRAHQDEAEQQSPATTEEPARPHSELAADALGQLLLAGASTGRPGRIGLYLHLELNDLTGGPKAIEELVESSGKPHTELGIDIGDDTLWALMCGGDITPVFSLDGTPLSYGRTRRLAPEVLTHILRHRDRHCVVPGCDVPALRLHMHHITHWENDGTTDPTNIAGVCPANHHDHHTRGWGIARAPDGTIQITHPDGTTFTARERWRRE